MGMPFVTYADLKVIADAIDDIPDGTAIDAGPELARRGVLQRGGDERCAELARSLVNIVVRGARA